MKAVRFDSHGNPPDVLTVQDAPTPTPGRGEVLVRMLASPVNPSDLLYIEGRYGLKPTFPATPGFEGVGVVEQSGGGLLGWFRKGKRVAVLGSRTGGWAEYAVAPAKQVVPVPDELPDDQAATFFVNPATAVVLTTQVLAVPKGEWLLQTAAGSALGKMVIALGKKHGFRTVNVVRRREQVDELKALGADAVLVDADGPIAEQVRAATGQAGVKYAIDPVGGETGAQVVEALDDGRDGRLLRPVVRRTGPGRSAAADHREQGRPRVLAVGLGERVVDRRQVEADPHRPRPAGRRGHSHRAWPTRSRSPTWPRPSAAPPPRARAARCCCGSRIRRGNDRRAGPFISCRRLNRR